MSAYFFNAISAHVFGRRLRDYESKCLETFIRALPEQEAVIAGRQYEQLDLARRFFEDKLVAFFFLKSTPIPSFSNHKEVVVATLVLKEERIRLTCKVGIIEGRLDYIRFSKDPRKLDCNKLQIAVKSLAIEEFKAVDTSIEIDQTTQNEILDYLKSKEPELKVFAPRSKASIEQFLKSLPATVPDDYCALIRGTNGFDASGWRFYGTDSRDLPSPHGSLIVLFEDEGQRSALVVKERVSWKLYQYDEIDEELKAVKSSFTQAVLSRLARNES